MLRNVVLGALMTALLGCQQAPIPDRPAAKSHAVQQVTSEERTRWARLSDGLTPWSLDLGGIVIASFEMKGSGYVLFFTHGREASLEAARQWKEKNPTARVTKLEERVVYHSKYHDGYSWRDDRTMEYLLWYQDKE